MGYYDFLNWCSYRTVPVILVSNYVSVSGMARYEVRILHFVNLVFSIMQVKLNIGIAKYERDVEFGLLDPEE